MYKFTLLLLAFAGVSCLAQTISNDPSPEPCPEVACAWSAENTCLSDDSAYTEESKRFGYQDDGTNACWYYDTSCVADGTRAECIPDKCRRVMVTCQPTNSLGQP